MMIRIAPHDLRNALNLSMLLAGSICFVSAMAQSNPPSTPIVLSETSEAEVKVACIGDSITAGYPNPGGFPPVLDGKLPDNYTVVNYGKRGATALGPGRGSSPYISTTEYANAIKSGAGIVVIMLGTNDSNNTSWVHESHFKEDLGKIVNNFLNLSHHPKVYLASTLPSFTTSEKINSLRIETLIGPRIRDLSNELGVQGIDTFTHFIDKKSLFIDGTHPKSEGHNILAQVIHDAITGPDDNT
ncbi:MAG: hypothetical protein JW706_07950, partial [Opitutales bacterium]|nr:hypothetical protein [Opitutales bacterium]